MNGKKKLIVQWDGETVGYLLPYRRGVSPSPTRAERLYALMHEVCAALAPALNPLAAKHERQYGASPIYASLVRIARDGLKLVMRIAESDGKSDETP